VGEFEPLQVGSAEPAGRLQRPALAAATIRPTRLDARQARTLQRTIGNRATARLLAPARAGQVLARSGCADTGTCADDTCVCTDKTQYDQKTIDFIKSLRYELHDYANFRERLAVAGCIADEYNTQRGVRGALDATQDWMIGHAPSWWIHAQRWADFKNKPLNDMRNDLGPANINLGTAVEYVEQGWLKIDGVDPKDIDYGKIVDFLLSSRGTVQMAAAVVRRAHGLFDRYTLNTLTPAYLDSVSVEYFKQGDKYYERFMDVLKTDPSHVPCPGDGGCRFLANIDRLRDAVNAPR
jgi:hypothetical protein